MSHEWEQYEERYTLRPETYEAYVDVWNRVPRARSEFTGWAIFSQMANAEPEKRRNHLSRVRLAEEIMREAGYEIGPTTKRGARRWFSEARGRESDSPVAARSDQALSPRDSQFADVSSTSPPPAQSSDIPAGVTTASVATTPPPEAPFADALIESQRYKVQLTSIGKSKLDEARVRSVLGVLTRHGGVASFAVIAQVVGMPATRVSEVLSILGKTLNIDGFAVLEIDYEAREARLNVALLVAQFFDGVNL